MGGFYSMYELKYIYVNNRSILQIYTPEQLPLEKCIENSIQDIHWKYRVSIYNTSTQKHIGLDAMTLLQERCTPNTRTWESFMAQMVPEYWIQMYEVPTYGFLPGTPYPYKAPTQIIIPTAHWVKVDYLNMKTPDYRNQFYLKYRQPDLCISFTDAAPNDVSLKNCIPICNGFTVLPKYINNELYIPNGARYLWETTDIYRPDIFLIDTTPIGGIHSMIPFKDLNIQYSNRTGTRATYSEWKIVFEDSEHLKKYTVLVVINGCIIFPDQIQRVGTNTITFHPSTLPLDIQMMVKYRAEGTPETVITNPMSVEEYLMEYIFSNECVDAFIINIPNTELYLYKPYSHHLYALSSFQYQNKLPIPLLRNKSTGQLHYYHISNYTKADCLDNPVRRELYYFDTPFLDKSTGSDIFPSKKIHYFENVVNGEYETLYLTTSIHH